MLWAKASWLKEAVWPNGKAQAESDRSGFSSSRVGYWLCDLGWTPPHLSWPSFPLLDSERLLILHGVCSGSGVRLFVLSVKSLMVILEGMWICVFIWVYLWREREKTFIHSDVCLLCAYFRWFIDMVHSQQLLLFSGYHVQGSGPRTVFFWVISPEGSHTMTKCPIPSINQNTRTPSIRVINILIWIDWEKSALWGFFPIFLSIWVFYFPSHNLVTLRTGRL